MLNIFLISDSTGETAEQLARAALAQFNNIEYSLERNVKKLRILFYFILWLTLHFWIMLKSFQNYIL